MNSDSLAQRYCMKNILTRVIEEIPSSESLSSQNVKRTKFHRIDSKQATMSSPKKLHHMPDPDSAISRHLEKEYAGLSTEETIEFLKREVLRLRDSSSHYYSTALSCNKSFIDGYGHIPVHGCDPVHCKEKLVQIHELDNRPRLNTSSYVNVVFEKEEKVNANMDVTSFCCLVYCSISHFLHYLNI